MSPSCPQPRALHRTRPVTLAHTRCMENPHSRSWPTDCPIALHREPAHRWVRRQQLGRAVRIAPGTYAHGPEWEALTPWQRRRVIVEAVHLSSPGTVFAGATSLQLRGIPMLDPRQHVQVLAGARRRCKHLTAVCGGRALAHYRLHYAPPGASLIERQGAWSSEALPDAVARVVLDPHTELPGAVVLFDGAWRASGSDPTFPDTVMAVAERACEKGARLARLQAALALASPLSESAAESLALVGIHLLGYAVPRQQVELIVEGRVYRPDFLWPGRLILEVDGAGKYAGADEARVRREEKDRQLALERAGYRVARAEWADVTVPERLRRLLGQLGVPSARR